MGKIPLMELSSLAEDIHVKTLETLGNNDHNMQDFFKDR